MAQEFLISSGTVDITPYRPVMLGGYNKRTAPFTAIAGRLEANVLSSAPISSIPAKRFVIV